jgi:AcrR family transcriptional regulator
MNPKAEKTRRVVEVAESLFASKGFDKTTIKEIAREAGVGVGTIYEYFPDKQSLLFAIPAVRIEEMINQLNECLYAVSGAFNKLRKLVHFFLSAYETNVSFARLMYLFMVPYIGWRNSPAYQLARSLTGILTAILREGQEGGAGGRVGEN